MQYDRMVEGAIVQTQGLEDGADSETRAWWLSGKVDYHWSPSTMISAAYQLSSVSTEWTGPAPDSMRDHQGKSARREDSIQTVLVGLSKTL